FLVDDAQGRIGHLHPGDRGYAAAALHGSRRRVVFSSGQQAGATRTLHLPAGRYFGLYLVQNGTTAQFLAQNSANRAEGNPQAFFSFVQANPDKFGHLRWLSANQFAFEDGSQGGDQDFNDLIARIEFGTLGGTTVVPPPGGTTVVPPPPGGTTSLPPN